MYHFKIILKLAIQLQLDNIFSVKISFMLTCSLQIFVHSHFYLERPNSEWEVMGFNPSNYIKGFIWLTFSILFIYFVFILLASKVAAQFGELGMQRRINFRF